MLKFLMPLMPSLSPLLQNEVDKATKRRRGGDDDEKKGGATGSGPAAA